MPQRNDPRMLLFFRLLSIIVFVAASAAVSAAQTGAIAAVDEPPPLEAVGEAPASASGKASGRQSAATRSRRTTASASSPAKVSPKTPNAGAYRGPMLGDKYTFLNFEVVSAEKPYYTRAAKAAGAKGLVQVEIVIAENGTVISARARTGNKLLWPEAERAALASRFDPPSADGRPARATGFLVYRFGPAED